MDVKGELKDGAQGIMFNQGVIAQIAKLLIDLGILKEGQVENLDSFTAVISKIIDDLQQDVLDNKANNKTDTLGVKDRPVMNPDQKKGASPGDTKNTNPLDLPYLLPPDWFNPEIFNSRRVSWAPLILLAGLALEIYAIMTPSEKNG